MIATKAVHDRLRVSSIVVPGVAESFEHTGMWWVGQYNLPDLRKLWEKMYAINATGTEVDVPLLQRWRASEPNPNDPEDDVRERVAVSQTTVQTWLQKLGLKCPKSNRTSVGTKK